MENYFPAKIKTLNVVSPSKNKTKPRVEYLSSVVLIETCLIQDFWIAKFWEREMASPIGKVREFLDL